MTEVIFSAPVTVQQRQDGYVRFSYLPPNSLTPQRYRCQPDLALTAARDAISALDDNQPAPSEEIRAMQAAAQTPTEEGLLPTEKRDEELSTEISRFFSMLKILLVFNMI